MEEFDFSLFEKTRRPGCVTGFAIFFVLVGIYFVMLLIASLASEFNYPGDEIFITALTGLAFVNFAAAVGIWRLTFWGHRFATAITTIGTVFGCLFVFVDLTEGSISYSPIFLLVNFVIAFWFYQHPELFSKRKKAATIPMFSLKQTLFPKKHKRKTKEKRKNVLPPSFTDEYLESLLSDEPVSLDDSLTYE